MTRKRFSEREVLEALAWQGIFVTCHRCKEQFFVYNLNTLSDAFTAAALGQRVMHMAKKPEREHIHEYKLGGPDTPANCRYSCSECHSKITNGTKATSAGSSKQRIAKVKRLLNPKPSKRPMQENGRKMQSRPFPKRPEART